MSYTETAALLQENLTPDGLSYLTEQQSQLKWEQPIPFYEISTPSFPTESLPAPIAAFVEALSESTQTPEEMSAVLSLGVLSTTLQGKFEVEIHSDWREPLNLYTVAIAPPGERKSAVIGHLTAPLREYENDRLTHDAEAIAINQAERRMLEKSLQSAEASVGKGKCTRDQVRALASELENFKDIHPFRLLVDDVTPEKLTNILSEQGGKLTISSAEGGVFDSISGRYDKTLNIDVYLKAHAGDPIRVDRVGRHADSIMRPSMTMLLTIQPEVLTGIMNNTTFRGRGLVGRFLYAVCRSKIGHRDVNPLPIGDSVKTNYRSLVRRLLSIETAGILHLDDNAKLVMLEYARSVEVRLDGEWEHMRDWAGKLVGAMLRIAGLIHIAEASGLPNESNISEETIGAAVKIAECLASHATAAYQTMGADDSIENARYLWKRILEAGQDEMTKRDVFHLCRGRYAKVEDMERPLQLLFEMSYLRESERQTGGRPSTIIIVNPIAQKAHKSQKYPR